LSDTKVVTKLIQYREFFLTSSQFTKYKKMKGSIVQKVRDIFHQFNIDPKTIFLNDEEEVTLEIEGKLADGTVIFTSAPEWTSGVDVYTKDEGGVATPLMAGEYSLEDGRIVIIGEDSKIAEIKEVEVEVEEEMSSDDLLTTIESLGSRVSELETKNAELMEKLGESETENQTKSAQLSALKLELSEIKSSPAAASVKDKSVHLGRVQQAQPAVPNKPFHRMSMRERIEYNLQNQK
jgi:hypothetical protein